MFPGYPATSGSGKPVGGLLTGNADLDAARRAKIAEAWPLLLKAMDGAQINTPRRIAAFLTTLVLESRLQYDAVDGTYGTRPFPGMGLIQLTGEWNFGAAGNYLGGVDLRTKDPVTGLEMARRLPWSISIAIWYWTVARPNSNKAADQLKMGLINRYIGYPLAGSNDADRCMVFRHALEYLTQTDEVIVVDCSREAVLS